MQEIQTIRGGNGERRQQAAASLVSSDVVRDPDALD